MRGTDWQEVNRKITEFYNAIKECEFFFVRSGKETEYAEISKYITPINRAFGEKFQNMDVWKKGMIRVRNVLRRTGL